MKHDLSITQSNYAMVPRRGRRKHNELPADEKPNELIFQPKGKNIKKYIK